MEEGSLHSSFIVNWEESSSGLQVGFFNVTLMQWKCLASPHPKEARMSNSKVKTVLWRGSTPVFRTSSGCQPEVLSPSFIISMTVGSSCEAKIFHLQMDPAPWQCAVTHSTSHHGSLGEKIDPGCGTPGLFIRTHSRLLLSLPYHEDSSQRITIWNWKRFRRLKQQS